MAIKWLEHMEKVMRIRIKHAENGGEVVIPGTKYKVDGFNKALNIVFEFYGDVYHGNLKRFKPTDTPNPYSTLTAKQLHAETIARERKLRELGYTVVSVWESDWKKLTLAQATR